MTGRELRILRRLDVGPQRTFELELSIGGSTRLVEQALRSLYRQGFILRDPVDGLVQITDAGREMKEAMTP